jgi:alpha-glucosidase
VNGLALPHHDGSERYVSDLAPGVGDLVTVHVLVPRRFECGRVWVRTTPDGEPRFVEGSVDRTTAEGTWWRVDVRIRNPVTTYRFALEGGASGYRWLNGSGVVEHDVPDVDDFRITTFPAAPGWLTDRIAYQIFPDRFASSGTSRNWPEWARVSAWDDPIDARQPTKQVYGGDLAGIELHLDHIERLGANLVYLTPFFPAESSHRYDATTFEHVDPLLGGDAALASLVDAAHRRGIRILGDITANHSGSGHEWFRAARSNPASAEGGFYLFRDHPDDYESWFGVRSLPKFDLRSAALRERLLDGSRSVVGRYLGPTVGLDGWRVDVANMAGRHGEVDVNRDVAIRMRRTIAEVRPDAYLVAEHLYDAHADLHGDGWHGTMSYAGFTEPAWSWLAGDDAARIRFTKPFGIRRLGAAAVAATMRAFNAIVPWRTLVANLNLLDSHDTARFRTIAGSPDRMIAGVGLLMAWPGVPMLFAGDEVGVQGRSADEGRRPMPWDVDRWDDQVFEGCRRLIRLRRDSHALRRGGLRWVHARGDVLAFLRESLGERVLVQISRDDHEPVRLDTGSLGAGRGTGLLHGTDDLPMDGPSVLLPSHGPSVHVWRLEP